MRHGRHVSKSKAVRGTLLSAVVAGLGLLASQGQAANVYWDGVSGNWTDLANWSTDAANAALDPLAVPAGADIAIFNITGVNGAQTVYLNGDQAISGFLVNNTGLTTILGGNSGAGATNTLTLGGGSITTGVGQVILGGPGAAVNVSLAENQNWNIGAGGMTVNGGIGGAFSITKTGTGRLILNGTNTYSGGTNVTGGGSAVQFANLAAMPASGTVTLATGTSLIANVGGANEFTATGTGAGSIAGLLSGVGGQGAPVVFQGGSSLGVDTTNAPGAVVYSNAFTTSTSVGLVKLGTGTLSLTNGGTYGGAGAAGFPLVVRQGRLLLDGGVHTVNGETVIGGQYTTANGAAGYDAQLQVNAGTLTVGGWLSIGRGNGTGTVSSDLIINNSAVVTAQNMSAGFNGGSGTNLPKGSITLNNNATLSITGNGAFVLGESAGSDFTMTVNDSAIVSAPGTATKYIGQQAGKASLTVNGGTVTLGSAVRVSGSGSNGAFAGGSGTLTMNGGVMNVGSLAVSRGNNNQYVNNGYVNMNGGTLNSEGDLTLGFAGAGNTGQLNMTGGVINVATTTTRWMIVGHWDTSKGEFNMSGGSLNLNAGTSMKFNAGNTTGGNVVNQNGGVITFYSDNGLTVGGGGNVDLMQAGAAASNNVYNLNGGTLTTPAVISATANGTRTFNFNGGVLRAAGPSTNFFSLNATASGFANVRNGGAIIDSNGHNVTIAHPLMHSNVVGDNAIDGGLTKRGAGNLSLTMANSYTGPTTVTGGKLVLADSGDINTTSSITLNGGGLVVNGGVPVNPTINVVSGSLEGSGSVNAVVVSNNAANWLGNTANGVLTIGSLTFSGAAAFNLNVTGTSPEINVSSLSTNAAGSVVVNASAALWLPGQYDLVGYGTLGGAGFSRFTKGTIAGLSPRQNASLVNTGSAIALSIVGDNPSWSGLGNGEWTTAVQSPKNWKLIAGGTPTDFINGDVVLFDDTATGTTTVTIPGANVTPASVTFNNTNLLYTINGPFGIAGTGNVTLNGYGTVVMAAPNTYSGGTVVNNGTLDIQHASAIGTGTLTLGNGTSLDNSSNAAVTLSTNNAQVWAGDFLYKGMSDLNLGTGAVTMTGNRVVTVDYSGVLTVGGGISGAGMSLMKAGSGTLRLTGANTYDGGTQVNNGTLEIAGGSLGQTTRDIQISADGNGNGTVVVSGGNVQASRVIIGGNSGNNGIPTSGTLTQSAGTITSAQWFSVGSGVAGTGIALTGVYNMSGGVLNVIGQQIEVANFAQTTGIVNMTGGTVNVMNNNFISFGSNNGANDGTWNQSGGSVNFFSDANGTTSGGTGVLFLGRSATLAGTYTYNLDGGTLTVPQIQSNTANASTSILNLNGGLLKAGRANATFITGLDQINVGPNGARIDDGGFAVTIGQDLSNNGGGLTKSGAGTLTFTGNGNYTGATNVTAGKMVLAGAGNVNGSSGVAVTGGAKLVVTSSVPVSTPVTLTSGSVDGTGTYSSVTVASNVANIVANGNGTTAPLAINNLTLSGAATLNINVNSTAAGLVTTSLIANGAGGVVVNANNASWTTGTTYQLVSYNTLGGTGFGAFTLGQISGLTPRQSAQLVNPAGAIGIQITGGNVPVWTGALDGVWTAAVQAEPKNWKLLSGGTTTDFLTGDDVLFDDSATGTTAVNIAAANVAPTATTFANNTKNYTVTSTGGFGISSGFVVKSGTGTVTLATNNTYAGGTTLTAGKLILNHTSSIGTGTLTLAGGTLDTTGGDLVLATNNNTAITGDFAFAGTNSLNLGAGTVTLGGAAGSRTANILAGTLGIGSIPVATAGIGLTKTGAGTLLIGGANNAPVSRIDGTLDIQAGTVQVIQDTNVTGLTGSGVLEAVAGKWFFVNNAADNTFSGIIRDGSGVLGLNKNGAGKLVLTGNNNYSLATTVQRGTLVFSGNTNNTTQVSAVATAASANGVLVISPLSTFGVNYNPGQFTSALTVGSAAGAAGAVRLSNNGTLTVGAQFGLGTGAGGYAAYTQEGGSATINSFTVVGFNNDRSVLNLKGGTFSLNTNLMTIGAGGSLSMGVVNVSGGTLTSTATTGNATTIGGLFVGENGKGTLNVMGTGVVNASGFAARVGQLAGSTGTINLLGGTLSATSVSKGAGSGRLNFNGGTLRNHGGENLNFIQNLDAVTVYGGGATIDDNNANLTITVPLTGATGGGVSATGVTVSGGGFIDTPLVEVSGDGVGATAIANIDANGNLTGITMTSPGTGYTNATFTLLGGGVGNTGAVGGSPTIVQNTAGGLTKKGTGTLTLTAAATLGGPVNVQGGKLALTGAVTHTVGALRGTAVSIDAGTTVVTAPSAGASKLDSLAIAGTTGAWTGKLDLANNTLILTAADATAQGTVLSTVTDQLASGKAGGAWNGTGITSSTMTDSTFAAANTLVVVDNGDLGATTLQGQTGLDANTTIVAIAHNGDATLDGKVDAFDLNKLASNWQASGKSWVSGDFTGDGKVDAFDLNTLASNWQFGTAGSLEAALADFPVFGAAVSGAVAAVPEPASLAVLALGGAALLGRRRRK